VKPRRYDPRGMDKLEDFLRRLKKRGSEFLRDVGMLLFAFGFLDPILHLFTQKQEVGKVQVAFAMIGLMVIGLTFFLVGVWLDES